MLELPVMLGSFDLGTPIVGDGSLDGSSAPPVGWGSPEAMHTVAKHNGGQGLFDTAAILDMVGIFTDDMVGFSTLDGFMACAGWEGVYISRPAGINLGGGRRTPVNIVLAQGQQELVQQMPAKPSVVSLFAIQEKGSGINVQMPSVTQKLHARLQQPQLAGGRATTISFPERLLYLVVNLTVAGELIQ
ncbi:hypothetical protein BDR07DRAFT_1538057 [Suillus spraguei]|nr:hypothetical protein BDR07DRAFT_1538057 [Suillus spraguei]